MAKSALKFKDSVAQYERIAAEVAARRFSGIYLLMGEESYFIDALSDQLGAAPVAQGDVRAAADVKAL